MRHILTLSTSLLTVALLQSTPLISCAGQRALLGTEIEFDVPIQLRGCGCNGGGKKNPNRPLPSN